MKHLSKILLITISFISFIYANTNIIPEKEYELIIEGNNRINTKELINVLEIERNMFSALFLNPMVKKTQIKENHLKFLNYYKENGFYNTEIQVIILTNKVVYKIEEGYLLNIKDILIIDNNSFNINKLYKMIDFKKGDEFSLVKYENIKKKIYKMLKNSGIPNPIFKLSMYFNEEEKNIDFELEIPKQNKKIIRKVNIINKTRIETSRIKKYIDIKIGEVYNFKKEEETYKNINSLHMFKNINIEYKEINEDEVEMNIYIKNVIFSKYKVSLGFDTDEHLKLKLDLKNSNMLNTFGNLTNSLKVSSTNQYISNKYKKHLEEKNQSLSNLIFFEHKKNDKFEYRTIKTIFDYEIKNDKQFHSFFYSYSANNITYDFLNSSINSNSIYNIGTLGYKFSYININKDKNGITQLNGNKYIFKIEAGSQYIGSNYDYAKVKLQMSHLFDIYSNNKLFIKNRYEEVVNLDNIPYLPTPFLIPIGGSISNRGIDYEQYYAERLFEQNLELHTLITENMYINNFVDLSYFEFNNKSTLITSIGIGMRYKTPLGVFKLDFGKELKKDFKDFKINFGYGYGF